MQDASIVVGCVYPSRMLYSFAFAVLAFGQHLPQRTWGICFVLSSAYWHYRNVRVIEDDAHIVFKVLSFGQRLFYLARCAC